VLPVATHGHDPSLSKKIKIALFMRLPEKSGSTGLLLHKTVCRPADDQLQSTTTMTRR
jgi:hypothetical protein